MAKMKPCWWSWGVKEAKLARIAVEWFDCGCGLVAGTYDRTGLEHKQQGEMVKELSRRDHVTRSM